MQLNITLTKQLTKLKVGNYGSKIIKNSQITKVIHKTQDTNKIIAPTMNFN